MSAVALIIVKALISLTVSLAVLRMLSGPLENVLVRLCPDAQVADFWVTYTRVMLIIAPLLLGKAAYAGLEPEPEKKPKKAKSKPRKKKG